MLIELYERLHSRPAGPVQNVIQPADDVVLALKNAIKNHVTFVAEHQDLAAIFFHEEAELNSEFRQVVKVWTRNYGKSIEEMIRKGIEQGLFLDFDPCVIMNLIMGMCNWVYQWYKPSGKLSADQIGEFIELGRLAIDDDERRAVALGHQRKPRRRPHHQ